MRAIGLLLTWAWTACAQNPPAEYLDLYSSLQQKLATFGETLNSEWDGSKPPVDFCAELLSANANRGLALLGPTAAGGLQLELQSLKETGVTAVSVAADFPILYPPFFQYNGDPGDYQSLLTYYKTVAAAVRALGLRLVVHAGPIYTGAFSAGSGLNVSGYYGTLSSTAYIQARARQIVTIARELQPDYLVLAEEPDVEAAIAGQPSIGNSAGYSVMVDNFLSSLNSAGLTGTNVGAGVGTWLGGASDFIAALAAKPRLDFIDLHVGPINADLLDRTAELIDQAAASGKTVTVASAWLEKRRDSEYPAPNIGRDPVITARNDFSFWQPVDFQFLTEMVQLAWWKHLALLSPFWSDLFDAYLDYNASTGAMPYNSLLSMLNQAASAAMQNHQNTSTGEAWQSLVQIPVAMPELVSAASGQPGPVTPDSIVTVYGSQLADSTVAATLPLETELAGVTLTFNDSAGNVADAPLYFVSPTQVNALVPDGLADGEAGFQIGNYSGFVTLAAVAPSLFSANSTGRGPAVAYVSRQHAGGSVTIETTATCTASGCTNTPIDLSIATDRVTLILSGTGIRGLHSTADLRVSIGGVLVTASYAGPQEKYPGLDQVNVPLPNALAGRGVVNIDLSIAGHHANIVTVAIQ